MKADILLKNYTEALVAAKKAFLLEKTFVAIPTQTPFWLGMAYIYNGKVDIAQKYLPKIEHASLAQLQLLKNVYIERLVELDPKNLQLRASLAATYYEIGEYKKACEEVEKLLETPNIDPEAQKAAEAFLKQLSCN